MMMPTTSLYSPPGPPVTRGKLGCDRLVSEPTLSELNTILMCLISVTQLHILESRLNIGILPILMWNLLLPIIFILDTSPSEEAVIGVLHTGARDAESRTAAKMERTSKEKAFRNKMKKKLLLLKIVFLISPYKNIIIF